MSKKGVYSERQESAVTRDSALPHQRYRIILQARPGSDHKANVRALRWFIKALGRRAGLTCKEIAPVREEQREADAEPLGQARALPAGFVGPSGPSRQAPAGEPPTN